MSGRSEPARDISPGTGRGMSVSLGVSGTCASTPTESRIKLGFRYLIMLLVYPRSDTGVRAALARAYCSYSAQSSTGFERLRFFRWSLATAVE